MAPRPGEHGERGWSRPSTRQRAEALPKRVRRTIVARQIESERLIGWIQLAVVIGFAALYAVAPKSAPQGTVIDPVPIALAAYLLFTLLRLADRAGAARGRRVGKPAQAASGGVRSSTSKAS